MSKRKLLELVEEETTSAAGTIRACPRICGLRRRGYTPEAIRLFCERIGVAKFNSVIDMALLEYCIREDLNRRAAARHGRAAAAKVVIDNYPGRAGRRAGRDQQSRRPGGRHRKVPFCASSTSSKTISAKTRPRNSSAWPRAAKCGCATPIWSPAPSVVKDPQTGEITELHCTYDPATRGGNTPDGRKVKGTIHWVSAERPCRPRCGCTITCSPSPTRATCRKGSDYKANLNPKSLEVLPTAGVEPRSPAARPAIASSSSGRAIFASIGRLAARPAGF